MGGGFEGGEKRGGGGGRAFSPRALVVVLLPVADCTIESRNYYLGREVHTQRGRKRAYVPGAERRRGSCVTDVTNPHPLFGHPVSMIEKESS